MKKVTGFFNKHLATCILIVLISGSFASYIISMDSGYLKKNRDNLASRVENLEYSFSKTMFNEQIDKAGVQADNVKTYLRDMLSLKYEGNMDKLRYDLENPNNNAPAFKTMSVIEGMYINKDTDSNDMFIATKEGVLSDFSLDCATDKITRNWQEEILMHHNKLLAKKAISDIVDTNERYTIWQFSKPTGTAKEMPMYVDMDFEGLQKVYNEYGIDGLRSFEVLVISRLEENKDIFGERDVTLTGIRQKNMKLFIVQGINMADVYEENSALFLNDLKNERDSIRTFFENYEYMRQLVNIMILFIFISTALSLMIYNNKKSKGE